MGILHSHCLLVWFVELTKSREWLPEESKNRKRKFTLGRMLEWVEKYENIAGHFCFFEAYVHFSPLYEQVGKHLFSMKSWLLAQWMLNAHPSLSNIKSSPRIDINSLMRKGLLCSELGRISSISIMPAKLSRERFMQELMEQRRVEGHC
jgi:hypothetical protein